MYEVNYNNDEKNIISIKDPHKKAIYVDNGKSAYIINKICKPLSDVIRNIIQIGKQMNLEFKSSMLGVI